MRLHRREALGADPLHGLAGGPAACGGLPRHRAEKASIRHRQDVVEFARPCLPARLAGTYARWV